MQPKYIESDSSLTLSGCSAYAVQTQEFVLAPVSLSDVLEFAKGRAGCNLQRGEQAVIGEEASKLRLARGQAICNVRTGEASAKGATKLQLATTRVSCSMRHAE